jgi:peptidoglycan-associated lipoprotein
MRRLLPVFAILALAATVSGCKKTPPAAPPPAPTPFPGAGPSRPATSPVTTEAPPPPPVIPMEPPVMAVADPLTTSSIEEINKESPLRPVFFAYDSDALDDEARATMAANADVLKKYGTWIVTIEGHCDERGTAEYNLALGDRRALAVKNYMMSLGISADRIRTVSYGSEFPFAPGHDDASWAQNRRAHFMLTAK